ncbi:PREDICTED: sister chromatid cohesion 1 protein 4 [Populus euphratica]|uniref:Sister chromatid cohesion 1 protein 4 n=1 Tax=Populus euphratica TaxID=75702 RepID=A0AAJ6TE36_POPEU|nr:PREDICTED: sister chromatid cohesion 1 protein 4 [Populus euphratica]
MFYSQFILAKKGPLGTIWIAAHLERKLRKNQVADTDIGVSVDSILFPDVPIALRLSSHLLLGVVRIYSRKVSYLFDDCSEALLKVKQAFRSTAVDLPPEESTAPYHSITLPETFDLDDFELPDNDIFQGNYVDHHISTREQITLQDTMDGVVYSTSQFGLDERFGDGDTSHVDLDLEEDLFLDKVAAPRSDEVSELSLQQTSAEPLEPKVEEDHDVIGTAEAMPVNGTRNKMGSQASNSESLDYAQAPSTPGLVEEPNLSSVQDGLACDDHLKSEDNNLTDGIESTGNASSKPNHHRDDTMNLSLGNHLNCDTVVCIPAEENGCLPGDLEINQAESQGELLSTSVNIDCLAADGTVCALDGSKNVEVINNIVCNGEVTVPFVDKINGECRESTGVRLHEPDNLEIANAVEDLSSLGKAVDANTGCPLELAGAPEGDAQAHRGPEDPDSSSKDDGEKTHNCMGVLRACNSYMSGPDSSFHGINNDDFQLPPETQGLAPCSLEMSNGEEVFHASGISTKVQGEKCHVTDVIQSVENQISELNLPGEIQADGGKLNSPLTSELPTPEKLLSLPQGLLDKPNDLLVESTPVEEIVDGGDRSSAGTNITGKKRSFTESSLTVQSLNSVDSFGVSRSKRTVDSIPDDDDLLSSILVGRRSSVLKVKTTPPAPEVASMKRARSASRPSAMKRKVLMDDSMVLLGDTIRQQLTNTEDIRRIRKKAPCTRTEILMIQRQSLDEEIFSEPVLTGMSAELTCLHSETFDLSRIEIDDNDDNNASVVAKDSSRPAVAQVNELEASTEPVICRKDVDGQPAENLIWTEKQGQMSAIVDVSGYRSSEHGIFGEITEMEVDKGNVEVTDAANHTTILHFDGSHTELISGDAGDMVDGMALMDGFTGTDGSLQMDASILPSDMMDTQVFGEVDLRDVSDGKTLDDIEVLKHHKQNIVAVETESREWELLLEESEAGGPAEIRVDFQADGSAPADDADTLLASISSEIGECINLTSVNVDQTQDGVENDKLGDGNEDGGLAMSSGHVDKDRDSNHLCNEELMTNPTFPVGSDTDFKNDSLNGGDYPVSRETDPQRIVDAEITYADHPADLQDVAFANDTEFLNVDDDEMGGNDDDGIPGPEDACLLDNSGWSSRTRAVAKYLQTIFDNEGGNGRKVISVDNLLAGKTRKEASRMFFETLVLKTRDYIHVDQLKPFDSINVKPRAKLMKSDF